MLAAKCTLIGSDYQLAQSLLVSLEMRPYRSNRELLSEFCLLEPSQITHDDSLCLMVAWAYTGNGRTDQARKWIERVEQHQLLGQKPSMESERSQEDQIGLAGQHSPVTIAIHCVLAQCEDIDGNIEKVLSLVKLIQSEANDGPDILKAYIEESLGAVYQSFGTLGAARQHYINAVAIADLSDFRYLVTLSRYRLLLLDMLEGNYLNARLLAEEYLKKASKDDDFVSGYQVVLALLDLKELKVESAAKRINEAKNVLSWYRHRNMFARLEVTRALCLSLQGQNDEAYRTIIQTNLKIQRNPLPQGVAWFALVCQAHIALSCGYTEEANRIYTTLSRVMNPGALHCIEDVGVLKAHVYFQEGDYDKAFKIASSVADQARAADHESALVDAVLLMAAVQYRRNQLVKARKILERVLAMAERLRYGASFVQLGTTGMLMLHDYISHAGSRGAIAGYARRILATINELRNLHEGKGNLPSDCSQRLTEREREVLQQLNLGLSRAEIASALNVSLNTVKSHISRIYEKLDVKSRNEAFFVTQHLQGEASGQNGQKDQEGKRDKRVGNKGTNNTKGEVKTGRGAAFLAPEGIKRKE